MRTFLMPVLAALASVAAADGGLPRVWMSYRQGADEKADCLDMKAHGVDVVQFGCSGVAACRRHLEAIRAAGLKFSFQVQDVTEYFSTVKLNGLEPEPAVMIGGVYRGKAIDRHVFDFAARKHKIVIEPPVYSSKFPGRLGSVGLNRAENGSPIGHYMPGTVPVRAEIALALKPFDGKQHVRIIPASVTPAGADAVLEVDSVAEGRWRKSPEYLQRTLYQVEFDLSGCESAMLDRVGIAVYWQMLPPPKGYSNYRDGMVAPAAPSTKEATHRDTLRRIAMWAEANGGKFPSELLAGVRFGDESFLATCHLNGPAVNYPLWDFSAYGIAAFRKLAGEGVEYPRTWGRADIYGADAYACWQYAYHKSCAELARIVRETVRQQLPGVPVFRNTMRNGAFALSNDHDGTGQELLARELDLVHLDPYPVRGEEYGTDIPEDMGYAAGFSRRFRKPLFPWLQAHKYARLSDPKAHQIRRMADEHWREGVDAVQWLGYGHTFPDKEPESWKEAAKFHARLHRELPPKRRAELAVLRPYSTWAVSHLEEDGKRRNPADWMLQQYLKAWSVDCGRAYDVFEIPPRETAAEREERGRKLKEYARIVSTIPYPGATVIGMGTEGTLVDENTADTVRSAYKEKMK